MFSQNIKLWRSKHRGEAEEGGEKGKSNGGKEDKSSYHLNVAVLVLPRSEASLILLA